MLTGARLSHLIVYAHDLAESTRFYRDRLGLPVLAEDRDCVRFDAGRIELHLQPAAAHGVQLFGERDDSSDVVFLVEDLARMRTALESRGVVFKRRRSYEVGLVTDFYDPNGHRLMLYEPSPTALTWPSADKIRQVWAEAGLGGPELIGPGAGPATGTDEETGLFGNPLIYLFMFENSQTAAYDFYNDALGLTSLERVHCCNQDCDAEIEGIVKYDGGGVLLSTHHMHPSSMVLDDSPTLPASSARSTGRASRRCSRSTTSTHWWTGSPRGESCSVTECGTALTAQWRASRIRSGTRSFCTNRPARRSPPSARVARSG
jgi:catechol 2,3-dioxygenase-like lactoylglutathione lyase family enzyme